MDAVVTAGGIPLPDDPLYAYTRGRLKALVDIAGKPMIQWVLNALSQSRTTNNVIIVGLTDKASLRCSKRLYFVPNQGKMLDNFRAGVTKALEVNKRAKHILLVSADIPTITAEMVDWVVNTALETDEDVYYNIIKREVMEKRFPGCKRTWTRLKDIEVCGGDMHVVRAKLVTGETGLWEKITNARKSPLKQATLIGYGTAFRLLTGNLTVAEAEQRVMDKLDITGRAVLCPYAEVGMDVDKPVHLEVVLKDFKRRSKKAGKSAPSIQPPAKGKPAARAGKKAAKQASKGRAAARPSPKGRKAAPKRKQPARKTTR